MEDVIKWVNAYAKYVAALVTAVVMVVTVVIPDLSDEAQGIAVAVEGLLGSFAVKQIPNVVPDPVDGSTVEPVSDM